MYQTAFIVFGFCKYRIFLQIFLQRRSGFCKYTTMWKKHTADGKTDRQSGDRDATPLHGILPCPESKPQISKLAR